MSLRRRIPLVAVQRAIYKLLQDCPITVNGKPVAVYDDVPRNVEALPRITFGDFTHNTGAGKVTEMGDISLRLHIWSRYNGKKEVNEIADDLTSILTSVPLDLQRDGFKAVSQDVTFFEAFEADQHGYHGVLTFNAKIQNLGG